LALVPAELLYTLSPAKLAALPADYLATLDEGAQQTIANILVWDAVYQAELAAADAEPETAQLESPVEPQPLPESWLAAAAATGQTLETTADVDATVAAGIVEFAPQLVADLETAQWLALSPDAAAILLPALEVQDPVLLAQLTAIANAAAGIEPEPQPLPQEMIDAAAGAGQTLETTADITVESIELLATFAPEMLALVPAELLYSLSPAKLAALPATYTATLDEEAQQTITNILLWDEAYQAALVETPDETGEEVTATPEPTPEPVDPARLPDILIGAAGQFGVELENAQDITPEFMRLIGAAGEQASALLGLLTPDNLRLLQPEVIALLPADFVDSLDADLRAELDELAAEFGGAGQLAIQEAEERAEAAASSPPLAGIWLEPDPEGNPPLFTTAADILNNQFMPGAAAFLNVFPSSPNVENPRDWMSALTVDVIQYLADNEEDFVANLDPLIVELMSPEVIQFMLDNYPEAFDAETTAYLGGIAAGTVEVFVPEASIVRTNGNPALVLSIFKDGDANTVVVSERVFEFLDEYSEGHGEVEYRVVFEQASFIEQAIEGVTGEASRGALVAILIILAFLSGKVNGKFKLSWRAVLVIGVSIPLSILTAILFMGWIPSLLGQPLAEWADSSGSAAIRFIAQLFPTEFTLNILTLSGLTVAIGRVVDDSIVVLENSYRYIQQGIAPREAVIIATKEVAIAIFAATATTMAVFLPLGLVGGLISSFFLPFGLTVAYALAASFVVSITVVPVLTMLLIRPEHIPEHKETRLQRWYTPTLEWSLNHRLVTLGLTLIVFVASVFLLGTLPQSFIPSLGEPTVNITVELPAGTKMAETDEMVRQFEAEVLGLDGVTAVQTEIGGSGGVEAFFGGGGGVSQNLANLQIAVEERFILDQEALGELTIVARHMAEDNFGVENVVVGAGSQANLGSGLALNLKGAEAPELAALVDDVKAIIGDIDLDANGSPD
ncbi:MAG: efflux RND transporter permease subunit, partial [Anaerolineales bacterium]|nr:efflux RND transporter permease subunit [Anaerolineales bacterium]